jgi:phosphonate transport system substrate-binding protein
LLLSETVLSEQGRSACGRIDLEGIGLNHELRCLRIASCMAPNADRMCRAIVDMLGRELAMPVHWIDEVPWYEREGMLDAGEIDLCWICGLPYVDKANRGAAIAACVAPVMRHPRYGGAAVYFSDVVVRAAVAPIRNRKDAVTTAA